MISMRCWHWFGRPARPRKRKMRRRAHPEHWGIAEVGIVDDQPVALQHWQTFNEWNCTNTKTNRPTQHKRTSCQRLLCVRVLCVCVCCVVCVLCCVVCVCVCVCVCGTARGDQQHTDCAATQYRGGTHVARTIVPKATIQTYLRAFVPAKISQSFCAGKSNDKYWFSGHLNQYMSFANGLWLHLNVPLDVPRTTAATELVYHSERT
jgi:hypothetical protein